MAEKDKEISPLFEQELRDKYRANISHTFLLYGATYDYAHEHMTLKQRLQMLVTKNSDHSKSVIVYDSANGITFPGSSDKDKFMQALGADFDSTFGGSSLPRDPAAAFNYIDIAMRRDDFALIVDYAESVFPAGEMSQLNPSDRSALVYLLKWAKDAKEIRDRGNLIMLITTTLSNINAAVREPSSRIESIGIPYPNPEERQSFIESTVKKLKGNSNPISFKNGFGVEAMSRTTAGLSKVHIYDIFQRARLEKRPISQSLVRERKDEIIKQEFQDVLQVIEPSFGFDLIGGYDYIKDYFRKNIITAVNNGNIRRAPVGVLMMGPAGTGKTALAEALACECGFNYVNFNVQRTKEKWVGNSESNLEKALWAIKSLTPIIVFIDEIDTAVSRSGGGDSGVSQNIMRRLLEVMSDTTNRGKIIWLAATNKPEDIDFALKRTGRFDKKIPVLPPSEEELPHIYMAMLKKHGINHNMKLDALKAINTHNSHWGKASLVGSDVEAIILKAYEISEDRESKTVEVEHIKEALELITPSVQDTSAMIASALRECNDRSLIPEKYRGEKWKVKDVTTEFERQL